MHLLSWTLLQRLNVLNHSSLENHPVCLREVDFPPAWKTIDRALGRLLVVVVFGVIGALIIGTQYDSVVVACLNGAACLLFPALIVAPSLALWTLPLGLTLGPVIVRERERQTWDTIRTIPLDLDLLLVCKARGALWWLVGGLRNLRVLLAFMGSIVGLGALLVLDTSVNLERQIDSDLLMFVIVVIVLTGGMLLFVFDRAQQLVLMCLAALVTSATSRSMRVAVAGAATSVFVTWLAEVCIGIALLTVLTPPENAAYSAIGIFALLTLGPTAGLLAMLPLGRALIVIALLVALRELVARGLWAWTVRAARE